MLFKGACLLMLASLAAGASLDWDFPSEIGLPANQPYPPMTIALGQGVTFNWQGTHGVYELAQGTGVGCPASYSSSGPSVLAPTANGGSYTFTPTTTGIYNIACQVGDHCQDGMLIQITVTSGPAPAPGPGLAPSLAPTATGG